MDKAVSKKGRLYRRAAEHAGLTDVDACVASYESRLARMYASELYREHDRYPTIDTEHVYSVIAMCLELLGHGLPDSEVFDAVNAAFTARRRFFDTLMAAIDRLPFAWAIARRWNVSDHTGRVRDGSIDYDHFEAREHSIEYRISGCRYVDMFEAWGVRRMCKIFCETDTRSYAGLSRHMEFVRHSDLSDGSACHDEVYERGWRGRA